REVFTLALALFEEVSEKKYQSEFCQLGGLNGKSSKLNPAMSIRRGCQKEDKHEQCHHNCEAGEDNSRMAVRMIVDLHHDEHYRQPKRRKEQLLESKEI